MYVCICNAIRERDVREAARRVPGDAEAIYASLGKAPRRPAYRMSLREGASRRSNLSMLEPRPAPRPRHQSTPPFRGVSVSLSGF